MRVGGTAGPAPNRTHAPRPPPTPPPPSPSSRNGVIDRDELRRVLESTAGGAACTLGHWLTDADVDGVLRAYGGGPGAASLTKAQFSALLADGVLLAGTLDDYAAAFAAADAGGNGTVSATELADLLRALGRPLSYDALVAAMAKFDVDASGRIDFPEFLRIFRKATGDDGEPLLSLSSLLDYASLTPTPAAAAAAAAAPHATPTLGEVGDVFSAAELDAVLAARAAAAGGAAPTVLMASLTWCRPCKALGRPLKQLAAAYPGVLFLKLFGDADANTKALFRDTLKVRSTPTFFFFAGSTLAASHTGANKAKLELAVRDAVVAGGVDAGDLPKPVFPLEPKPTGGW